MAFSEVNIFPWMLDIPCSFRVQTIIDFNFCLQATAGEESGVNLTSSGGFAVIATLWMGMADIDVTKIATPIPGILSWRRSSSDVEIKGLEGFSDWMIFSLGLEPEAPSPLRIFWSVKRSLFLLSFLQTGYMAKRRTHWTTTLGSAEWTFSLKKGIDQGTTAESLSHSVCIPDEVKA